MRLCFFFPTNHSLVHPIHPHCHVDINICVQIYLIPVYLFIQPLIYISVIYLSKLCSSFLPVFWYKYSCLILLDMPLSLPSLPFPPMQLKICRQVRHLGRNAPNSWACKVLPAIVLIFCMHYIQLCGSLLSFFLEDNWHFPESILHLPTCS